MTDGTRQHHTVAKREQKEGVAQEKGEIEGRNGMFGARVSFGGQDGIVGPKQVGKAMFNCDGNKAKTEAGFKRACW